MKVQRSKAKQVKIELYEDTQVLLDFMRTKVKFSYFLNS